MRPTKFSRFRCRKLAWMISFLALHYLGCVLGQNRGVGESSRRAEYNSVWKDLWVALTLGKVKHFIWKCFHCIVSVKEMLSKRKVTGEPLCPVCCEEPESLLRLFSCCEFAQAVWIFSPLCLDSVTVGGEDFRDWFSTLLARWKGGGENEARLSLAFAIILAFTVGNYEKLQSEITRAQFEGDSLNLIKMIKAELAIHKDIEVKVQGIRRLACDFRVSPLKFVSSVLLDYLPQESINSVFFLTPSQECYFSDTNNVQETYNALENNFSIPLFYSNALREDVLCLEEEMRSGDLGSADGVQLANVDERGKELLQLKRKFDKPKFSHRCCR
ncbi:hypothetical protein Vadar_004813 [Vaccinium darrowii]|uniref:Uncharacterized protein n=1 Tax=Vaccinium darrowii TaxID=229202 RepID=A0ACB7Y648_9ERIC|nr:hypothetical protein Vadar_004813 [Vaccinium darrowii]